MFIYENPDGFNTRIGGNAKLNTATEVMDELEAGLVVYLEHTITSTHKETVNGIGQMFNGGTTEMQTQSGHVSHEKVGRTQHGGTKYLLYKNLIEQYKFKASG